MLSKSEQRNLIDQHLDLNATVGISSKMFLPDEEMQLSITMSNNQIRENKQVRKILCTKINLFLKILAKKSSECDSEINDETEHVLNEFIHQLLQDLANQKWQNRHGGALALQKIIIHVFDR